MTTPNAAEKDYDNIDKELGEDHVRKLVQNLMAVEQNGDTAYLNLMELHKQCCAVFSKYPNERPKSRDSKKEDVKRKISSKK